MARAETRTSGDRVLVVLMCETRAWELTAESLSSNVLDELSADLALCVGDRESPNPLYERAAHVWRLAEPDDWAEGLDRIAGNTRWRALLEVDEKLVGANGGTGILVNGSVGDPAQPRISSPGIQLCFQAFLKKSLEQAGLTDQYDWIVVTRSDLLWPVPHPDVRYLSDRHIYLLDAERYGGVPDRHLILPRRFVRRFLTVSDPVFRDPESLKRGIERRCAVQGWSFVNPERFLASRLKDLGLWRRLRYIPCMPFAVRPPGGSTRWSEGVFDEDAGYFVKYPSERERSQVAQRSIRDQRSWREYLSPIRGARMRRRLRDAYPSPGEYDRDAFPRVRGVHVRIYRRSLWTVEPHLDRLRIAILRVGAQLRKVPALRSLLDARVRRIERRAERRQAAAQRRTEEIAVREPEPGD